MNEQCGEDRVNLEGQDLFGNPVSFNSELEVILHLTVVPRSVPHEHSFTRTVFRSFRNPFSFSSAAK